ncbi:hypothetical protein [Streptomyces sp. NPDC050121]
MGRPKHTLAAGTGDPYADARVVRGDPTGAADQVPAAVDEWADLMPEAG